MKVLSIIILSLMAIIFVLYFCDYFVYLKRVKYAENKVKLKGTNYKTSILWCALSIGWILISSSRYKEARICGDRNEAEWSINGIFQARVLEWGAIAFSNISHCLLIFPLHK